MIDKIIVGIMSPFVIVVLCGGLLLATRFDSPDPRQPRARRANNHLKNEDVSAAQRADLRPGHPYLARVLEVPKERLRELCRPTSFYIPMLSSFLALLYGNRAMEDHHVSLPGVEDYESACPRTSRRTATGVLVKLFTATVTTVGVHGHLNSLNGLKSWKFELFRALEVIVNPLTSISLFITVL